MGSDPCTHPAGLPTAGRQRVKTSGWLDFQSMQRRKAHVLPR